MVNHVTMSRIINKIYINSYEENDLILDCLTVPIWALMKCTVQDA